ncbi:MAG: hypothetical protein IJO34_02615 [Akkermansia sp.]|nr:hypothetical protein [Akkermansia sp.]
MLESGTMKGLFILSAVVIALATSCAPYAPEAPLTKTATVVSGGTTATNPANSLGNVLRNRQYLALPGQSPVAVQNDTDAAFDQQAAEYAGGAQMVPATASQPVAAPATPVAMPATPGAPVVGNFASFQNAASSAVASVFPGAGAAPAASAPAAQPQLMDYTVRIINGTPNRLFIEAQDATGTIYPCGFMHKDRSYSTPMVQAEPIHGPITVVVRDPDQPDAPELRRYKVNPPPFNYAGRTVTIKILPGGYYQAMVDGIVYYISPAPEGAPKVAPKPAAPAPAEGAAAPKPAEQPATPAPAAPAPAPAAA